VSKKKTELPQLENGIGVGEVLKVYSWVEVNLLGT